MSIANHIIKTARWLRRLTFGLVAAVFISTVALAQPNGNTLLKPTGGFDEPKRVALVIGNSAYQHVQALRNPQHDAGSVATKLQALGYEIQYAQNVDRHGMNEAISAFLGRVEVGTQTLIYYSGHGVELNGANYLLPTDIPALSSDQERMLRTEGISVSDLLLDIEARHALMTLVILDACRDNPFRVAGTYGNSKSLGATKGLARVDPPSGSFVIFAAGVGEEALDNLGSTDNDPNGLFTRKLLMLMDENGLEIRSLVRKLRSEVRLAALTTPDHHSQVPSYYDQMLGEFYFHQDVQSLPNLKKEIAPSVQVAPPPPNMLYPPVAVPKHEFQIASLPPVTPPLRPVLPHVCRPGEKWNGIECEQTACLLGFKRSFSGLCQRFHVRNPTRHRLIAPRRIVVLRNDNENSAKIERPKNVQRRSGGCAHVGGESFC